MSVLDTLRERGFIEQLTHEEEITKLLETEKVRFYIGFDPTADSLTVGHFMVIMAMAHMQRAGHTPVALMGGGTGMVGDPTGNTDMRRVMPNEEIEYNISRFKEQFSKFLDFSDGKALIINNADWLMKLQYIPFLREYGAFFSINRMLAADSYKNRLEQGLTFFEFNYMIMQAYDFLSLNRSHGVTMQCGGNDQWSNIIAGVELIRKADGKSAYGMTFTLLTTSTGAKMGKSMSGALWLDPNKTSPYEFYQYFRNTDDADVIKFMKLLTFVPMEEINELEKLKGADLNKVKELLAYETTKLVHGEKEASEAEKAAKALFYGAGEGGSIPETVLDSALFGNGYGILALMEDVGMAGSRSEVRRLITQGGVSVNGEKVTAVDFCVTADMFTDGSVMLQKGKKVFHKITIK